MISIKQHCQKPLFAVIATLIICLVNCKEESLSKRNLPTTTVDEVPGLEVTKTLTPDAEEIISLESTELHFERGSVDRTLSVKLNKLSSPPELADVELGAIAGDVVQIEIYDSETGVIHGSDVLVKNFEIRQRLKQSVEDERLGMFVVTDPGTTSQAVAFIAAANLTSINGRLALNAVNSVAQSLRVTHAIVWVGVAVSLGNTAEIQIGGVISSAAESTGTTSTPVVTAPPATTPAESFGPRLSLASGATCFINSNGDLKCWGGGDKGQNGNGSSERIGDNPGEVSPSLAAINLGAGRKAKKVVMGESAFVCAILDNGKVKCWGTNLYGSLGIGLAANVERGAALGDMGDNLPELNFGTSERVIDLALGLSAGCAIFESRIVKCWGKNSQGILGYGDTNHRGTSSNHMGSNLLNVPLGTGKTVKQMSMGGHACAVLNDGTVKCWGQNAYGSLGRGQVGNTGSAPDEMGDNLPIVELGNTGPASSVHVGLSSDMQDDGTGFTCVRFVSGKVKCWGINNAGQLGLGHVNDMGNDEMGDDLPFVNLGTNKTAKQIAVGRFHVCALLSDDTVRCWGRNKSGELGLGHINKIGDQPNEMGDNLVPVNLGTNRRAIYIAAGTESTCAVLDNESLKCWGWNTTGNLGLGDTNHRGDGPNEMGDNLPAVTP